MTLEALLIFFTRADCDPPLGLHPQPTLNFSDDIFATASTCEMALYLPVVHRSDYNSFRDMFILSLRGMVDLELLEPSIYV